MIWQPSFFNFGVGGGDFREKDLASLFKKYNCWFPKMENTTLPNLFCDWLWKYLELTWLWDYFGDVMILSTFQRDDIFPCWILFAGYQNATDMSKYSRTDGVNSLRIKKKKKGSKFQALFFSCIPPEVFVVWVDSTWHLNIWWRPRCS